MIDVHNPSLLLSDNDSGYETTSDDIKIAGDYEQAKKLYSSISDVMQGRGQV